ncbi:MAG: phosphoribosylformylglycinamidine cyclo-ligase [Verrucomicrobia bacterium]|nr:phosphoribosylformylglycinamidine cyclo-ligase [Verrucomicrobiota bacterium]
MTKRKSAYAAAGVDIDNKMRALTAIKALVKRTVIPGVLSDIGSFGGMFASPGRDHVLVASTDGVGTKLKVAAMAGRHDTIGQDLVNHCVNDILVQGAFPLFFLDYIGTSHFEAPIFRDVIAGLCKACRENGCALLGGETAEMPGLYPPHEYDLVGTIVGAVPRKGVIAGRGIRAGDVVIGLPSTGLHTNGYSLARRVVFEQAGLKIQSRFPGTQRSVADILLAVHRSYLKPVRRLLQQVPVQGMAHITGGGLLDNVPRILPDGVSIRIDTGAWSPGPLFDFLQREGRVDTDEMYRVFNMGVGYVVIVRSTHAAPALRQLRAMRASPVVIGVAVRGKRQVLLAR